MEQLNNSDFGTLNTQARNEKSAVGIMQKSCSGPAASMRANLRAKQTFGVRVCVGGEYGNYTFVLSLNPCQQNKESSSSKEKPNLEMFDKAPVEEQDIPIFAVKSRRHARQLIRSP